MSFEDNGDALGSGLGNFIADEGDGARDRAGQARCVCGGVVGGAEMVWQEGEVAVRWRRGSSGSPLVRGRALARPDTARVGCRAGGKGGTE